MLLKNDFYQKGSDHQCSLEPADLASLVKLAKQRWANIWQIGFHRSVHSNSIVVTKDQVHFNRERIYSIRDLSKTSKRFSYIWLKKSNICLSSVSLSCTHRPGMGTLRELYPDEGKVLKTYFSGNKGIQKLILGFGLGPWFWWEGAVQERAGLQEEAGQDHRGQEEDCQGWSHILQWHFLGHQTPQKSLNLVKNEETLEIILGKKNILRHSCY